MTLDTITDVDDFLAHFGVKGMKWGVRKVDETTGEIPQSHYRTMMQAAYLKKGMSLAEAQRKTDKAIRVQKIVAITAGVAVASLATYVVANKLGKEFTGVHIREGTTLQHISKSDALGLNDQHLYTTFKKADKFNYQGTFAAEMGSLTGIQNHTIKLSTTKAVKAPSNVQAQKILGELRGKTVSKSEYRSFINSFYKSSSTEGEMAKFKDLLGSKGFNAVIDTTDQNAYAKAFKPIIVFNSNANLVEKGSRALSRSEVATKNATVRIAQLMTTPDPEVAAKVALGAGIIGAMQTAQTRNQKARIDKYFIDNPGSKLTRSEAALTLKLVP